MKHTAVTLKVEINVNELCEYLSKKYKTRLYLDKIHAGPQRNAVDIDVGIGGVGRFYFSGMHLLTIRERIAKRLKRLSKEGI